MNGFLGDLARWISSLTVTALVCAALPSAAPAAEATSATRPTVAVLPFANASGDRRQDFFAPGMTDEIATALTGVRGITVVARSSSFQLRSRSGLEIQWVAPVNSTCRPHVIGPHFAL